MSEEIDNNDIKGLGGWLILVGIFVVTSPVRWLNTIYLQIFSGITWEAISTTNYEHYDLIVWRAILIGEFVYNISLIILSIYLIYLFFSRHYLFPKFFIAVLLVPVVFIPLDSWAIRFLFPLEPIFDKETLNSFIRVLITSLVWIPYMLLSKRVKATFVERMPGNDV